MAVETGLRAPAAVRGQSPDRSAGIYQGMDFILQHGMRDVTGQGRGRCDPRRLLLRSARACEGMAAHGGPRPRP